MINVIKSPNSAIIVYLTCFDNIKKSTNPSFRPSRCSVSPFLLRRLAINSYFTINVTHKCVILRQSKIKHFNLIVNCSPKTFKILAAYIFPWVRVLYIINRERRAVHRYIPVTSPLRPGYVPRVNAAGAGGSDFNLLSYPIIIIFTTILYGYYQCFLVFSDITDFSSVIGKACSFSSLTKLRLFHNLLNI